MTVSNNTPVEVYVGDGSSTVFTFPFRADTSNVITAYLNDNETAGFTVALNADQIGNPGGSITFGVGMAPPLGGILTIERHTPDEQNTSFTAYGRFGAKSVETALDDTVMVVQELQALLARTVVIGRAEAYAMISTQLPPPAPGMVIGWVPVGNKYELANVGVTTIVPEDVPGVLRRNQPLTGAQDGANLAFHLAAVPIDVTSFDIYLGGLRVSSDQYVWTVGTTLVTYVSGSQPQPNQSHVADIWSTS